MVKTTRAQRVMLKRKHDQMTNSFIEQCARGEIPRWSLPTYKEFRKSVQPYFGGSGCIMVRYCGSMWLGIERDGYAHT